MTCGEPGNIVTTMVLVSATSATLSAPEAPSATSGGTLDRSMSNTVTSNPFLTRLLDMGVPMTPRPM